MARTKKPQGLSYGLQNFVSAWLHYYSFECSLALRYGFQPSYEIYYKDDELRLDGRFKSETSIVRYFDLTAVLNIFDVPYNADIIIQQAVEQGYLKESNFFKYQTDAGFVFQLADARAIGVVLNYFRKETTRFHHKHPEIAQFSDYFKKQPPKIKLKWWEDRFFANNLDDDLSIPVMDENYFFLEFVDDLPF